MGRTGRTVDDSVDDAIPARVAERLQWGEQVRPVARPHWVVFEGAFVLAVLVVAVVVFAAFVEPPFTRVAAVPAIPFLGALAAGFVALSNRLVVTDQRLVIVARATTGSVNLGDIRRLDVHQGFLGRRLDFGEVVMEGVPERGSRPPRARIKRVQHPHQLSTAIAQAARERGYELQTRIA